MFPERARLPIIPENTELQGILPNNKAYSGRSGGEPSENTVVDSLNRWFPTTGTWYAVRLRGADVCFSIPKMKASPLVQSACANSDRIFFELRTRLPKSLDFGRRLRQSIFSIEKWLGLVKFNMLSTTASSSRSLDELDGNTVADVASLPTRSRLARGRA